MLHVVSVTPCEADADVVVLVLANTIAMVVVAEMAMVAMFWGVW